MKTIILTSIIVFTSIFSYAGEKEYFQAMEKNLKEMSMANSSEDFQSVANNFERVGDAMADKWLPYYYVSYCYVNSIFAEGSTADIDNVLDKAERFLEKARQLSPENSEIEVLQGWIYQGRIQVDPMSRGAMYSQKAAASFAKAESIDPDNPRVDFLTGQNLLHTPEMFGGGKKAACPYFMEAMGKYETFEPESSISPTWGKEINNNLAKGCEL